MLPHEHRPMILGILTLSAVVLGFLFWLIYFQEPVSSEGGYLWLPAFNAGCNAVSALLVIIGLVAISKQRKRTHGVCMMGATLTSGLFLAGYLWWHSLHGDSPFMGQGLVRPVYYFILITHIVLSMAVVPLIFTTLGFAALRKWRAHRAVARWTYPIWIYVSVTGVLVFLFLRVWFPGA